MRLLLRVLVLCLLTTPRAAGQTPSFKIHRLGPSRQTRVVGARVLVLEKSLRHVAAYDRDGRRLWRTKYQTGQARGLQQLVELGGQPWIHAGSRLLKLDPTSGTILLSREVPGLDAVEERCGLRTERGLCAVACSCSYQLIDCRTGEWRGPRFDSQSICRRPMSGGPATCGCWTGGGSSIGRSGDLLIAQMRRPAPPAASHLLTFAVDERSGQVVWKSGALKDAMLHARHAGISADGRTAHVGDAYGNLTAFDARTGEVLWRVAANPSSHQPETHTAHLPGGIFHLTGTKATLHAERTGRTIWSVPTGGLALAAPGDAIPDDRVLQTRRGPVHLLAAADGVVQARLAITHDFAGVARLAPDRFLAVDGTELRLHDGQGKVLYRAQGSTAAVPSFGGELLALPLMQHLIVYERANLRVLGRLPGPHAVVDVGGALGPRHLVLTLQAPAAQRNARDPAQRKPDEALIVEVARRR